MDNLLTVREVAELLGISHQRVYQLDDVLKPTMQLRGTKMMTRFYSPEAVERVREERIITAKKAACPAWKRLESRGPILATVDQVVDIAARPCDCCGVTSEGGNYVEVVDGAVGAVTENLVSCCVECCELKGDADVKALVTRAWAIAQWQTRQ